MPRSIMPPTIKQEVTQVKKLTCKKCAYEWFPNRPELPKVCPRCKSYAWNGPFKKGK